MKRILKKQQHSYIMYVFHFVLFFFYASSDMFRLSHLFFNVVISFLPLHFAHVFIAFLLAHTRMERMMYNLLASNFTKSLIYEYWFRSFTKKILSVFEVEVIGAVIFAFACIQLYSCGLKHWLIIYNLKKNKFFLVSFVFLLFFVFGRIFRSWFLFHYLCLDFVCCFPYK